MLFVSYVPLLTTTKGLVRPPEQKDELIQMLTEASLCYRIEMVAWAMEEVNNRVKPHPIFVVQHAQDICKHMLEWSGKKPDNYFTLVWRPNGQGYDLALVPNFEKSARRYHQISGDTRQLTILGHLFLYQASYSQLDLQGLEGRTRVRLGWTSKVGDDGTFVDYSEVSVRLSKWDDLPTEDKGLLEGYWQKLN